MWYGDHAAEVMPGNELFNASLYDENRRCMSRRTGQNRTKAGHVRARGRAPGAEVRVRESEACAVCRRVHLYTL